MKKSILKLIPAVCFAGFIIPINSQTLLDADGPGNTYELINSVLAPGFDVMETPDCAHPAFGRHITEAWDSQLNRYVFEFHIHVTPDNDRCINFDRQRNEIKTYDKSPAHLIGVTGEFVTYKWKFKLATGFQVSSNFTHLHQVKAVGGDEADPIFCLTARKGYPNKLELNYYVDSDLNAVKLTSENLSLFENTWVEVTERIKIDNVNGTYSIVIKNVSTGATLLSYSNNQLLTIRADNAFIRPKWGVYRSLNAPQDLRDEIVRFASFSIEEDTHTSAPIVEGIIPKITVTPDLNINDQILNYSLEKQSRVSIQILNVLGKHIKTLLNNQMQHSGDYRLKIDNQTLSDGIYIVSLLTDKGQSTAKMVIKK